MTSYPTFANALHQVGNAPKDALNITVVGDADVENGFWNNLNYA